jgi:hypothetical protein
MLLKVWNCSRISSLKSFSLLSSSFCIFQKRLERSLPSGAGARGVGNGRRGRRFTDD